MLVMLCSPAINIYTMQSFNQVKLEMLGIPNPQIQTDIHILIFEIAHVPNK